LLSSSHARAEWIGAKAAEQTAAGNPADTETASSPSFTEQHGVASWYGRAWAGRRTASGEIFDMNAMTAAHHWLPFGTRVRVTLKETGEQIVVTITDRLAAARRVIDLSQGAARALGMLERGVAQVTIDPE
jgi:rare lipoprotein A